MKKNNKYINKFNPLIYTTILILIFMIIIPMMIMGNNSVSAGKIEVANGDDAIQTMESNETKVSINSKNTVSIYITLEDRIEEVNLEDYVCGVIANEMPVSFNVEALKAQAIASRTYVVSKMINKCSIGNGADICDSTHCQVYSSKEKVFQKWGEINSDEYWNKIKEAVDETKGKVLTYNNELVLYPQFFSTSSGKTESSVDVNGNDIPYLKSVDSLGEEIAPKFTSVKEVAIQELISTINSKYPNSGLNESNVADSIEVLSRSDAGGVIEIELGNQKVRGSEFRFLVGLNSTNFDYSIDGNKIIFNCKGYGHGIGMSQWGANVMGKNGSTYEEILKHYYTGVEINDLTFN